LKELGVGGPGTAAELTQRVYAVDLQGREELLGAAEMTLRAHLRKLVDEGGCMEMKLASTPSTTWEGRNAR